MKRSLQEIVELVVFGVIALLLGTGMLWFAGWIFEGMGWLFQFISGLLWQLLRFVVPVIIGAALIYWLVRYLMKSAEKPAPGAASPSPAAAPVATAPAAAAPAEPSADPAPAPEAPPAAPTVTEVAPPPSFDQTESGPPEHTDSDEPLRNG